MINNINKFGEKEIFKTLYDTYYDVCKLHIVVQLKKKTIVVKIPWCKLFYK